MDIVIQVLREVRRKIICGTNIPGIAVCEGRLRDGLIGDREMHFNTIRQLSALRQGNPSGFNFHGAGHVITLAAVASNCKSWHEVIGTARVASGRSSWTGAGRVTGLNSPDHWPDPTSISNHQPQKAAGRIKGDSGGAPIVRARGSLGHAGGGPVLQVRAGFGAIGDAGTRRVEAQAQTS